MLTLYTIQNDYVFSLKPKKFKQQTNSIALKSRSFKIPKRFWKMR